MTRDACVTRHATTTARTAQDVSDFVGGALRCITVHGGCLQNDVYVNKGVVRYAVLRA
jgi:hypothetical protein